MHITGLHFSNGPEFLNDDVVKIESLVSGIMVELDAPVIQESVQDKPVVRVVFDLPWPAVREAPFWSDEPIGFRETEIHGEINADGPLIVWNPTGRSRQWLQERFPEALSELRDRFPDAVKEGLVVARFIIDGWAIVGEDERLHLNTHANSFVDSGRTRLALPTDDEVTGGQFVQWFFVGRG